MCTTCGCSSDTHDDHDHAHAHDGSDHGHVHGKSKTISLQAEVLAKSQRLADQNRGWLQRHGVTMINVMSSPGAGKTTLLEKLVRKTSPRAVMVIEGDQATSYDADRIRAAGARAVQVNTGTGCHLDPHMVAHALDDLAPPRGALVIVENVGNLVCPALFDLGESERIVLLSTPEGDDKPRKYPHMFASASLVVVTKSDLLPYVPFDLAKCRAALAEVCPRAEVLTLSSTTGEGLDALVGWLARGPAANESAARATEVAP